MTEIQTEQEAQGQAVQVLERASALSVTDHKSAEEASLVLSSVKATIKAIKSYWELPVKRARDAWDILTERRGQMLAPLEQSEKAIKKMIVDYQVKVQAEAAEKERIAREAIMREEKRRQEELANEMAAFGDTQKAEEVRQAPVAAPQVVLATTPKVEGIQFSESWTFRVVDPSLIPREYLAVDEKKLAGLAKAMKADAKVPGVEFFSEKIVVAGR